MAKATGFVQRVLGFIFLAFGLNGFIHFIPQNTPSRALEFFIGMAAAGFLLPLLYTTQAIAGALLLVGLFVPLALAILAPIIVNILLFHLVLAPVGIPLALILVAFEGSLAWAYRDAFAPMLQPHVTPAEIERSETAHHPVTA